MKFTPGISLRLKFVIMSLKTDDISMATIDKKPRNQLTLDVT